MSCHLFHCQNQERWQLVDRSRRLHWGWKRVSLCSLCNPTGATLVTTLKLQLSLAGCAILMMCACNQPWLCFSVIWVICSSQKPEWQHRDHQAVRLLVKQSLLCNQHWSLFRWPHKLVHYTAFDCISRNHMLTMDTRHTLDSLRWGADAVTRGRSGVVITMRRKRTRGHIMPELSRKKNIPCHRKVF